MCGIVAVLPVYDEAAQAERPAPPAGALEAAASFVGGGALDPAGHQPAELQSHVEALTELLEAANHELSGPVVGHLLSGDLEVRAAAGRAAATVQTTLRDLDAWLDASATHLGPEAVERLQGPLRRALDLAWTATEDRIRASERVAALAGLPRGAQPLTLNASISYWALDTALDAIDRLEVRGRDSAGVHLWIALDETDRGAVPETMLRRRDPLFRSGSATPVTSGLSVVYKTASVVGRLGDNIASIRAQIADDADLQAVLRLPSARLAVLGHTRWASVGRVSAPNAHPLNSDVPAGPDGISATRYAVGVLNGDIDNHLALKQLHHVPDLPDITTDAKLIPVLTGRRMARGATAEAALAAGMGEFEGSMAIGVQTDEDPDRVLLGLKSGGQGIFVGLSDFGYVVASEIFGLVARADKYVALEAVAGDDGLREGLVVTVDRSGRGTLAGVRRVDAAGAEHDIPADQLRTTELTTRDVAQGEHRRYLEKELAEAPGSFRKTLRGRIGERDGQYVVTLPPTAFPQEQRELFAGGRIQQVIVIGQGTAAVAAQGVAHLMGMLLDDAVSVRAMPATELSAARLPHDMSGTCIVAISQSGTTTDTNRTVDLARARGATVLAIVNRRQSDLVLKSHGVLYTSDGRDIEMAVASTKAFYAQIAAGMLLGLGMARAAGSLDPHAEDAHLRSLLELPGHLEAVRDSQDRIAQIARRTASRHAYWAVVGSGANRIAASEVRIKLSELCYRGVSVDAVEDKKHIDLSAESCVLLCAAGAPVTQLPDIAKEVAIFSAHHNVPVVIADAGTGHLWECENVIEVPAAHPLLAWVLSTAAGHYFAYHAATTIDETADELRLALAELDAASDPDSAPAPGHDVPAPAVTGAFRPGTPGLRPSAAALGRARTHLDRFVEDTLSGRLRGAVASDQALRLTLAGLYLKGTVPAETVLSAAGLTGTANPIDAVRQVLTDAIEELTRSIDSVKHQAKTVTVGTSRTGADLLESRLARAVLELGLDADGLSYSTLVSLAALSPVITDVVGATRYAVTASPNEAEPTIRVRRKAGIAAGLPSRADAGTALTGTKKLAVDAHSVRLERGRRDGRTVVLIPEMSGLRVSGLSLLHVALKDRAGAPELLGALEQSGSRLAELQAAVTELDHPFDSDELAQLPVETVLLAPVDQVAAALLEGAELAAAVR